MNRHLTTGLAAAAVAAQPLFVAGWAILGALEGHGYDAGRHDISDLTALTAHHATLARLGTGLPGAATIAFALLALRPALRTQDGRGSIGPWLLALSLPGWDGLSDAFFRLDCRAADAGCSPADAFGSWHAKVHLLSFVIAALATIAAPFVLSRRMRQVDGWQDLARPTRIAGFAVIALLLITGVTSGTAIQGWTQRGAAALVSSGVALLAWRMLQLQSRPLRTATLAAGH
ncbi:hypothetical protein GCM10009630_13870 [Kribbella jejuensis]|uniref:Uncharacterized protein DUF998 n=1 Tax=Kribbella jejuensis TaxID=236068 RepID=A0A542DA82_9ACTN|nr:DUF998 domain-containing protein [Kribbella jejuensis]TQI99979.1 uncharacterized protein DUF998 [Kribbella jejuensis]